MNGIAVLADLNGHLTSNEQNRYIYSKIEDYPKLYETIRLMIAAKIERTNIVIQNQQLLAWVQEINHFVPKDMLNINEITLRQYVIQNWGITPPVYLDDADLKQIIGVFPQLKIQTNFEDDILEYYFHFSFEISNLSVLTLENIFNEADFSGFESLSNLSCIKKILSNKKKSSISKSKSFPLLFQLLYENPMKFKQVVGSYVILRKYSNEIKSRFLLEYLSELTNLEVKHFNHLELDIPKEIVNAISVEINGTIKNEKLIENDVVEIIRSTSGILENEFNLLFSYICSRHQQDRNRLVAELKKQFFSFLSKHPELSDDVDQLISPPFPTEPKFTDIDSWVKWATTEFLPYRYWLDRKNESNLTIDEFGLKFSDFMAANYLEIKFAYQNSIYRFLPNIKHSIEHQQFTVILIIDNLGVRWNNYLDDLFQVNEYESNSIETYIAAMPTDTRFSKTALLSSNVKYIKNDQDYRKLVIQKINEHFQNKQLAYVTNLRDIFSLPEESNFIIINYLMIDEYMHTDQNKMANPRFDNIRSELKSLINLICRQFSSKPNVDIFVVSDHGSTRIPEGSNIPIDTLVPLDRIEEIKERYIRISDEQLKRSRKWLENIGYIFDQDKFELDGNYVIPKGYQIFKKVTGERYYHGGISPEELLVPVLHFKRSKHTISSPQIFLKNNIFRFNVKSQISFIIENTNQVAISNVRLIITSSFISMEQENLEIGKIDALERREVTMDEIRLIRKASQTPKELSVMLHYQFGSANYREIIELPIKIKSIQENTFDLDF